MILTSRNTRSRRSERTKRRSAVTSSGMIERQDGEQVHQHQRLDREPQPSLHRVGIVRVFRARPHAHEVFPGEDRHGHDLEYQKGATGLLAQGCAIVSRAIASRLRRDERDEGDVEEVAWAVAFGRRLDDLVGAALDPAIHQALISALVRLRRTGRAAPCQCRGRSDRVRAPYPGTVSGASISSVMYLPSEKSLRSVYQRMRRPSRSVRLEYMDSHHM